MVTIDPAVDILKARFVGTLDSPKLKGRQIPVEVGEDSEFILQFGDDNMFRYFLKLIDNSKCQKEYNYFVEKIKILSEKEINSCLKCHFDDMVSVLNSTISCVGCRRAVENSFNLVSAMDYHTLNPIKLIKCREHEPSCDSCEFTLEYEYLRSTKKLFMLLYVCKPHMEFVINNIPKSRKNKRCNLHCLDSHKVKSINVWMDFWKSLNRDNREEIATINIDAFVEALESYLQKHRFCQECKAKVERAYKLLLKDVKPDENDIEYDEVVFDGIKVCKADRHLHIDSDDETISSLISRAEPELTNSRRERHAKTMDVAQEEVLTCLGIVLHEKMHKLCQKVKAEEQTWLILVNVCLECLKRRLVLAIEEKRGYSNLDLFLLEHEEETKKKEMKKEIKREKKRKKKLARKTTVEANYLCNHSPSKDEDSGNEEEEEYEDDEEEDDDDEEDEKELLKMPDKPKEETSSHSTNRHLSQPQPARLENSDRDDKNSEWQVVENSHCKQCNKRKVKSRGLSSSDKETSLQPSGVTDSSSSSMANSLSHATSDGDRHTNNNAQGSSTGNILSTKKKSKSSCDVTTSAANSVLCCGGATARSPMKAEKNHQSALNNHRNHSLQKPRVSVATNSNNNSKRSHCSRISSSLPSATGAAVSSCHQPAAKSTSCIESSCSQSTHTRRHNGNVQSVTPKKGGTSCCQHDCERVHSQVPSESSVRIVKRTIVGPSNARAAQSESVRNLLTESVGEQNLLQGPSFSPSDEPENGEDFLTEQERVFFEDNWETIKKTRDELRNKLRQAWSDKTKANG